jgi:hypothetical protein
LTALLGAINRARAQLASYAEVTLPSIGFGSDVPTSGGAVKAVHVQKLQGGVR